MLLLEKDFKLFNEGIIAPISNHRLNTHIDLTIFLSVQFPMDIYMEYWLIWMS